MPKYKLTYFNVTRRGEVIRWVFAAAGVEYEDIRVTDETWPEIKPKCPGGQIPILEVDDVIIFQSNVIARYLARQFGLAGKTDLDQAQVDAIVETVHENVNLMPPIIFGKDKTVTDALRKTYVEEKLPKLLTNLEQLASESGYFVGNELTLADIAFAHLPEWWPIANIQADLERFPKLKKIEENVRNHPKIAEWIEKRPKSY